MSEAEVSKLAVEDGVQALVGGSNAGVMLRKAREAQGLHIAMLAVALKVPVKKIEAIEDNRFDLLPDMVFVRALASSICRSLCQNLHPQKLRLKAMVIGPVTRITVVPCNQVGGLVLRILGE